MASKSDKRLEEAVIDRDMILIRWPGGGYISYDDTFTHNEKEYIVTGGKAHPLDGTVYARPVGGVEETFVPSTLEMLWVRREPWDKRPPLRMKN